MKQAISQRLAQLRALWSEQPKKRKIALSSAAGAIVVIAVAATVLLNAPMRGYRVLFSNMSEGESIEVYSVLREMNASPQLNSQGEVMVQSARWDELVFELAARGYPASTLTYDTFSSATGFTTTEFEKKRALVFQLNDRLQQTLIRQKGIRDAVVTFSLTDTSNRVWEQSRSEPSTAAVTVTMEAGYELTPERVSAIKNLAARSAPGLSPENVVVVDASTGLEVDEKSNRQAEGYSLSRLDFERQIEQALEDNVRRLLSVRYGPSGVVAVAKVTLDYDRMVTERKEYVPVDSTTAGVIRSSSEAYTRQEQGTAGGVAGEEYNTDVPLYLEADPAGAGGLSGYQKDIEYDVSYVLTQIEKGEPLLKRASIAVLVDDVDFNDQRQAQLADLISKGVGISTDNISVGSLSLTARQAGAQAQGVSLTGRQLLIGGIAALLVLTLLVLAVWLAGRGRKKKASKLNEQASPAKIDPAMEEERRQRELQQEVAEHKRMLQEEALTAEAAKEHAITQEVQDFAKSNPEITAMLIRSLLKEEK